MTPSNRSSKPNRPQKVLSVGTALVAVLVAVLLAGCSAIITKKIGEGECGDGIRNGEEQCDDKDFGGQDCTSTGNGPDGYLVCEENCIIDVQHCTGGQECGNDTVDIGEDCDGSHLNGETCVTLGFVGDGELACNDSCKYNTVSCEGGSFCGNGVAESAEDCDGADFKDATCETLGYVGDTLYCFGNCTYDLSMCGAPYSCGNNQIESPEHCESGNLDGHTCGSLGYQPGSGLLCGDDCQLNATDCNDPSGAVDGRICADDTMCAGKKCLKDVGGVGVAGYCSHSCLFGLCPGGGVCVVDGPGGLGPLCYELCASSATCQFSFECAPAYLGTPDICWPPPQ